ncbi:MAG TPA: hypothetical protein VET89_14455 [Stellaceae bacterium]|nr:hypothetical protein [Stellaceae bacterium]
MSGALARLVLRAQGRLPVAEPLLPSRFAPAGSDPAMTDPAAGEIEWGMPASETAPAPLARQATRAPRPPGAAAIDAEAAAAPSSPNPSPSRADTAAPTRDAPSRMMPVAPFAVRPEPVQAAPFAPPADPAGSLAPAETLAATANIAASRRAGSGPPAEAEALPPAAYRRPPVAAAFGPSAAASRRAAGTTTPFAASPPAPARAPDVQISIGRVEVHAGPARAAPPRVAQARRQPRPLADYLARRT